MVAPPGASLTSEVTSRQEGLMAASRLPRSRFGAVSSSLAGPSLRSPRSPRGSAGVRDGLDGRDEACAAPQRELRGWIGAKTEEIAMGDADSAGLRILGGRPESRGSGVRIRPRGAR